MLLKKLKHLLSSFIESKRNDSEHNDVEIVQLTGDYFIRKGINKEANEDICWLDGCYQSSGGAGRLQCITSKICYFAVIDGISAGGNGGRAAEMTVKLLEPFFAKHSGEESLDEDSLAQLEQHLRYVNKEVYRVFAEAGEEKWGATLALVVVYQNQCVTYNTGDSRIYWLTDGTLIQLSKDYTVEEYKRRLGFAQDDPYISEKDRSTLYQYIGKKNVEFHRYGPFRLSVNDKILICSDGMVNHLDRDIITSILKSDISDKGQYLADEACRAGSQDDQTGMLLSFKEVCKDEYNDAGNGLERM